MTDEERQKLVNLLRSCRIRLCIEAADEIERLFASEIEDMRAALPPAITDAQIKAFRIAFAECTMHHPNQRMLPPYAVQRGLEAAFAQSDAEPFKTCPMCGKDEDHEHNDAEVGAWLKTQSAQPDRTYPGGRTKAEWNVIARASFERAKELPDD